MQDDYVYFPYYQVYYSNSRRQYAYRQNNAWVSQPAPKGVTVNELLASPSALMDFHDSPANHDAAVVQKYPRDWAPPDPNQDQNDHQKDNQHGGNNSRQPGKLPSHT